MNKLFNLKVDLTLSNFDEFVDDFVMSFGINRKDINILSGDIDIYEKGLHYIYGKSGSGKSYILRQIAKRLNTKILKFDINKYDNIDLVLKDYISDIGILFKFGFSDIPVLLTKVRNLSDGQKYRLFLLENILNSDVIIIDEFCNPLDEFYTISILKTLEKLSKDKLIIVATSRQFGVKYIDAFVYEIKYNKIFKKYNKKIDIKQDLIFEKASKQDWKFFSHYHYRNKSAGIFNKALKVKFNNEYVGIIIAGNPSLSNSIRNKLFPIYKNNFKKINEDIFTIYRIVVVPEARNLGIAQSLLLEIEKLYENKKMIELFSSLIKYINFVEKIGYKYGGDLPDNDIRKICKKLNFDFKRYLDDEYVLFFVKNNFNDLFKVVLKYYNRKKYDNLLFEEKLDKVKYYIQVYSNSKTSYFYKLLDKHT